MTAGLVLCFFLFSSTHAFGLTIREEQEFGLEFMKMVRAQFEFINDPGVTAYVNEVGQKIVRNAGPQPFEYKFYVIKDDSYNAFAGPGAHICINSGLLVSMESESELAGILGHEIAHVTSRHISGKVKRGSKAGLITLAGVVAGILLGVGGLETAAQVVTMGTIGGMQSADLAYSREDEMEADSLGLSYLEKAGYSAKGLLTSLKRIKGTDYLGAEYPVYLSTHPAIDERIIFISSRIKDPKAETVYSPKFSLDFEQARMRLAVEHGKKDKVLNDFYQSVTKDPDSAMANYGYGLALMRAGKYDQSITYLEKTRAARPKDPFIKIDLGKAYCMNNQHETAITYLEDALSQVNNPEARLHLGKCQMEIGNLDQAESILKPLAEPDPELLPIAKPEDEKDEEEAMQREMEPSLMGIGPTKDPIVIQATYYLAEVYHKSGKMADSHYYLGTYHLDNGKPESAMFHLTKAHELSTDEAQKKKIAMLLKHMDRFERMNRNRQ